MDYLSINHEGPGLLIEDVEQQRSSSGSSVHSAALSALKEELIENAFERKTELYGEFRQDEHWL